jgi:hypothetical protein
MTEQHVCEQRTWEQFRDSGLLWLVNRTLHIFGWVIIFEVTSSGEVGKVYPARTKFRGFSAESDDSGFLRLTTYMKNESTALLADLSDEQKPVQ